MSKVEKIEKDKAAGDSAVYKFKCPGCGHWHSIDNRWNFNDDLENPTFRPSFLMRTGHFIPDHEGDCWCDYNEKNPDKEASFKCYQCHSYVTDGKIRFLNDCTHELAGQTVELPKL